MKHCDLLISAPWMLPVAPHNSILEDYCLAIDNGDILALGPRPRMLEEFSAGQVITLDHHILLPGLINAHGHGAMSLLRGAGEDQPLKTWLNDTIWPMEAELVNPEFVRLGTELAIAEMLLSGTTTFSDMYFFPEAAAEVSAAAGIRAQIAFPIIEFPNAWSENVTEALQKGLGLYNEYRHHNLVKVAFGPHSAYSLGAKEMEQVGMYADELDTAVQIHLHETAEEVHEATDAGGPSWIMKLNDMGMLGPRLQAVHMTQVTPQELELIATSQTKVVHCPTSNLKLASGYCPVTEFRAAGDAVLFSPACASFDMFADFEDRGRAFLDAVHRELEL